MPRIRFANKQPVFLADCCWPDCAFACIIIKLYARFAFVSLQLGPTLQGVRVSGDNGFPVDLTACPVILGVGVNAEFNGVAEGG